MSTTTMTVPVPPPILTMIYRLTVDEYDRMVESGALDRAPIELLDGLLVKKMPRNPQHVFATDELMRKLALRR